MSRRLQPLIATSLVGAGSIVTLALSVASMKVYALWVGPVGVGLLALLQSIVNLALLAASLGLQATAITSVAAEEDRTGRAGAIAVARTIVLIAIVAGAGAAIVLVLARVPVAEVMLGSERRSTDVILLAPALLLSLAATVQAAVLAGMHHLKLATAVVVTSGVVGTAMSIGLVAALGVDGFAWGLLAYSLVQAVLTTYSMRRVGVTLPWAHIRVAWRGAGKIATLGIPVAASQAVTSGAFFVIPVIVLHTLGSEEVGLYRGAAAISIGIGTFFLAGIHQDFLPRMAAAEDPSERVALIDRRMRLVIGMALPAILALLALGPMVLDVLYSIEFQRSIEILEWQLVGDLARLPTLILITAVLAVRNRTTYFGLEAATGTILIIATILGVAYFDFAGPGIGYASSSVAAYGIAWFFGHRSLGVVPGRLQLAVVTTAIGTTAVLIVDPDPAWRFVIFGAAAVVSSVVLWSRLLRLHRAADL